MAKAFRVRPSDLLGINQDFDAFRLDRAVYRFGKHVDAELDKVTGKNENEIKQKRLRVIARYFPKAQAASGSTKKFADPAARS